MVSMMPAVDVPILFCNSNTREERGEGEGSSAGGRLNKIVYVGVYI
jgi:hypothetical protein